MKKRKSKISYQAMVSCANLDDYVKKEEVEEE